MTDSSRKQWTFLHITLHSLRFREALAVWVLVSDYFGLSGRSFLQTGPCGAVLTAVSTQIAQTCWSVIGRSLTRKWCPETLLIWCVLTGRRGRVLLLRNSWLGTLCCWGLMMTMSPFNWTWSLKLASCNISSSPLPFSQRETGSGFGSELYQRPNPHHPVTSDTANDSEKRAPSDIVHIYKTHLYDTPALAAMTRSVTAEWNTY